MWKNNILSVTVFWLFILYLKNSKSVIYIYHHKGTLIQVEIIQFLTYNHIAIIQEYKIQIYILVNITRFLCKYLGKNQSFPFYKYDSYYL